MRHLCGGGGGGGAFDCRFELQIDHQRVRLSVRPTTKWSDGYFREGSDHRETGSIKLDPGISVGWAAGAWANYASRCGLSPTRRPPILTQQSFIIAVHVNRMIVLSNFLKKKIFLLCFARFTWIINACQGMQPIQELMKKFKVEISKITETECHQRGYLFTRADTPTDGDRSPIRRNGIKIPKMKRPFLGSFAPSEPRQTEPLALENPESKQVERKMLDAM